MMMDLQGAGVAVPQLLSKPLAVNLTALGGHASPPNLWRRIPWMIQFCFSKHSKMMSLLIYMHTSLHAETRQNPLKLLSIELYGGAPQLGRCSCGGQLA